MQRARTSSSDKFVKTLQQTCYGPIAPAVVDLFRRILQTYHQNDGDLSDDELSELADAIFAVIPTAHKTNMVGVHSVYKMAINDHVYRCTWRELLAKGSYNHVYYADLTILPPVHGPPKPQAAVVKVTVEVDDFRVYILENVIHAVLSVLPGMHDLVVPIRFPFKIPVRGVPPYTLGVVLDNPGYDNMGRFIEEKLEHDDEMFSLMTTTVLMLQQAQQICRFEHRDLKADNLMLRTAPADGAGASYPMFGRGLLFIDFGMTRFELDGEYIACDCMHTDTTFNPSHDLQSLMCTLVEDYAREFQKNAPQFYQYLKRMTTPIFNALRKLHANYDNLKSSSRHKKLCVFVAKERNNDFTPHKVLDDMMMYWKSK
jgi:hypothetical protein